MASAGQEKFDAQSSGRKSITPGFYDNKNKSPIKASDKDSDALKKDAAKDKKGAAAAAAEAGLAGAEKDAAGQEMNDADGVSAIGAKEDSLAGKYAAKVVETTTPLGILKRFKGKGPVGVVMLLLCLTGSLLFGMQSMMPFSLAEQLTEKFDILETTTNVRSNTLFRMQMKREGLHTITSKRIFGGEFFTMSKHQAKKLAQEGIVMQKVTNAKGKDQNVLLYDDGSGKQQIVVADQADIENIKGAIKNGKLNVNGQEIDVDVDNIKTHADSFETDTIYRNKIKKQTRTWAGSIGHWFDKKTADFLNNFAITRKIFAKFIERVQGEDMTDVRARTSETIANSGLQEDGGAEIEDSETVDGHKNVVKDVKDEDGNVTGHTTEREHRDIDINADQKVTDFDDLPEQKSDGSVYVQKRSSGVASTKISKASLDKAKVAKQKAENIRGILNTRAYKTAGALTTYGCIVLDLVGAAMLIAGAQETVQLLKVASSFLETVDKTKAGDGDASPFHTITTALVDKSKTITYSADDTYDENNVFNVTEKISDEESSAMQSNGVRSLYTEERINPNDESVKTFNLGDKFQSIWGKLSLGVNMFLTCSIAKIALNIASAAITTASIIAEIAGCIGTGFWGCMVVIGVEAGKAIGKAAGKAVVRGMAMSMAMPIVTQMVATWFMRDIVSELSGPHYGNAIVSAANKYMESNCRAGGCSLTNKEKYAEFRVAQEKVIAENAKYVRETRSPFDMTTEHTFMGTIMKQLITLSTMTGPLNVVSGISSVVSGSVLALMPSASAANNIEKDLMTDEEFNAACPYLASIGAVGDAYCNPYIISDMSSMGTHPDDIEQSLIERKQLELTTVNGEQRYEIVDGSNLAKYVVFCGQRTSAFGLMDTNIANAVTSSSYTSGSGLKSVANMAVGAVPVVGDLAGVLDDSKKLDNMDWISGEACVAGNNLDSNKNWENQGKIYQRYAEDQRLYASIDPSYESSVDTYIAKYREANPLDNSYEGILARFSGLPKDTVVAVLDFMEYERELAEYDPSERYVFQNDFDKLSEPVFFEFEEQPTVALQQHEIIYADIRNRAFAMA